MAIFDFLKTPKIRQYHHEYIYYDPQKEAREERIKRVQKKIQAKEKGGLYADNIKSAYSSHREERNRKMKSNNVRYIITAIVIVALVYWLK